MSDAASLRTVSEVVRRESASILQYLRDAFPWGTLRDAEAIAAFDAMIAEEGEAIVSLIRYLARHHVPAPHAGTFSVDFTSLNFIAFEYLLPRVIDYEMQSEAGLREAAGAVADPEARRLLLAFADLKKQHRETLERLKSRALAAAS